ncbi:hypothetical protein DOTSEDRAFT_22586 [Dothistroma septosporum NZE10]|uniref:Uncharacterized protein n=1 Tax=Dothistroma septosporum (strain NZE10 / CBS 128990) TaxID=675120 RepID=N1PVZ9_DOTSN|nr:hypothetical protein DOTSEDRAFT_22586 [Dothistroma septosporum NZE10]
MLIAMSAFVAPTACTMVAPALDTTADVYRIESQIEKFLKMSILVLAFATGPFVFSEVFARVCVVRGANLIFLMVNAACGFAKAKQQMTVFRSYLG